MKNKIISEFKKKFEGTPRLFFSPGRINLIGEHIDYNQGYVMPAAINKGIYFAIALNNTNTANFFSFNMSDSFSISLDTISKGEGWRNYVLGVLHVLKEQNRIIAGFDCVFGGNIPVGAGLSSSAAVEGGLIYALNTLFNLELDRVEMAKLAQKAEHGYPNVKCGIMDQFANLNGKKNHVILLDCLNLEYQYLPLDLKGYSIYLFNTRVNHSLASGEYNERRADCDEGFAILQKKIGGDITSWRQISPVQVKVNKSYLTDRLFKRCLFVTEEISRTQKASEFLKQKKLVEFGKLMFQTHVGLSQLYDVSCPELDFLAYYANSLSGVIGARLMGGGFGGCTINIIKKGREDDIWGMRYLYLKKFKKKLGVYRVTTSDGVHEMK